MVRAIKQKDNHTFIIEWSDGRVCDYRLNDLQASCPCAACVDETTGKRLLNKANLNPDVRATRLTNVGRYALRVHFTSGCSNGIYSFDHLIKLGTE